MKTIYTVESELLNQRITITDTNGTLEVDTADGVHYSQKEILLCFYAEKRHEILKKLHRVKKIFDGEVIGIENLKDTQEEKNKWQKEKLF